MYLCFAQSAAIREAQPEARRSLYKTQTSQRKARKARNQITEVKTIKALKETCMALLNKKNIAVTIKKSLAENQAKKCHCLGSLLSSF